MGDWLIYSKIYAENILYENNIFVGLKGDVAFTIGHKLRSVIMLRGNSHDLGLARVSNNIFVNNHPSKDGAGTFFRVRDNLPVPWDQHNNLYYNNIAASDTTYGDNATDVATSSPALSNPSITGTANPDLNMISALRNNFTISSMSSAADKDVDAIQIPGHPNWSPRETNRRWDRLKASRPSEDSWDLGINEIQ